VAFRTRKRAGTADVALGLALLAAFAAVALTNSAAPPEGRDPE